MPTGNDDEGEEEDDTVMPTENVMPTGNDDDDEEQNDATMPAGFDSDEEEDDAAMPTGNVDGDEEENNAEMPAGFDSDEKEDDAAMPAGFHSDEEEEDSATNARPKSAAKPSAAGLKLSLAESQVWCHRNLDLIYQMIDAKEDLPCKSNLDPGKREFTTEEMKASNMDVVISARHNGSLNTVS